MGLFDFFSKERSRERFLIGDFDRKFRGSATEMAETLISYWNEYRRVKPDFNPQQSSQYAAMMQAQDAFKWICLKIGYDESWACTFCNEALKGPFLGNLAVVILTNDTLLGNKDLKKQARAVQEVHRIFSSQLPDQLGRLEEENRFWQS